VEERAKRKNNLIRPDEGHLLDDFGILPADIAGVVKKSGRWMGLH
jgi:hypothetical protein